MLKTLSVFCIFILVSSSVYATEPCREPSAQWFQDNVIKKSDLAVYARIEDFSEIKDVSEADKKGWTKVHVMRELLGRSAPSELTVQQWQAHLHPLYGYEKGDYIVLWLRRNNDAYVVTNIDWMACVPSVWAADANGKAAPWLEPFNNKGLLPLQEIEDTLGITRK